MDDGSETARQATGKQEQAEGRPSALKPVLREDRRVPVLSAAISRNAFLVSHPLEIVEPAA